METTSTQTNRSEPSTSVVPRIGRAFVTITPCWKVYIGRNIRVHHGLMGEAALLTAALPLSLAVRISLAAFGAALVWHDRRDWPFPLRDRPALTFADARRSPSGHRN